MKYLKAHAAVEKNLQRLYPHKASNGIGWPWRTPQPTQYINSCIGSFQNWNRLNHGYSSKLTSSHERNSKSDGRWSSYGNNCSNSNRRDNGNSRSRSNTKSRHSRKPGARWWKDGVRKPTSSTTRENADLLCRVKDRPTPADEPKNGSGHHRQPAGKGISDCCDDKNDRGDQPPGSRKQGAHHQKNNGAIHSYLEGRRFLVGVPHSSPSRTFSTTLCSTSKSHPESKWWHSWMMSPL